LYYTLIHPHLTYGLPVWGSTYKMFLHKMEVFKNKSIQSITKSKYNESNGPIYETNLEYYHYPNITNQKQLNSFF
jgi:hypothetical protein